MPLTKVTSNGITDSAVNSDKIADCGVAAADIGSNPVTLVYFLLMFILDLRMIKQNYL